MKIVKTGLSSTGRAHKVSLVFEKREFDKKVTGDISLHISYKGMFSLEDVVDIPHWKVEELKQLIDETVKEKQ